MCGAWSSSPNITTACCWVELPGYRGIVGTFIFLHQEKLKSEFVWQHVLFVGVEREEGSGCAPGRKDLLVFISLLAGLLIWENKSKAEPRKLLPGRPGVRGEGWRRRPLLPREQQQNKPNHPSCLDVMQRAKQCLGPPMFSTALFSFALLAHTKVIGFTYQAACWGRFTKHISHLTEQRLRGVFTASRPNIWMIRSQQIAQYHLKEKTSTSLTVLLTASVSVPIVCFEPWSKTSYIRPVLMLTGALTFYFHIFITTNIKYSFHSSNDS